jgi:hypothetical protein
VQPVLSSAEAASDTQQPVGGGKKEKERQRKERQRQRRTEEAREVLQVAMEAMALGSRCVSSLWLMCIGRFPGEGGGVFVRVAGTHSRVAVCVAPAGRVRWAR